MITYDPDTGKQIIFKALYQDMKAKGLSSMEMTVLVSKGKKKRCRLVITIMPEEEYQKWIRKVNKKNKETGHTTSEDYKARVWFNLFITNVPAELLSGEKLYTLYRLRWQIELLSF